MAAVGLSIVELLGVVAILAILLTMGAGFLRTDRTSVSQAAQGLSSQIQRARLEAIRRNTFAGVCFSNTGSGSYSLRTASLATGVCPSGTLITEIRMGQDTLGQVRLSNEGSSGFSGIVFNSRGMVSGVATTTVTLSNIANNFSKQVVVNPQGRASVQ